MNRFIFFYCIVISLILSRTNSIFAQTSASVSVGYDKEENFGKKWIGSTDMGLSVSVTPEEGSFNPLKTAVANAAGLSWEFGQPNKRGSNTESGVTFVCDLPTVKEKSYAPSFNGEFKGTGGTGNAPTWKAFGEFNLVTVTIKVEEKPWGQGWLTPEDKGGNWYVLWSCDQHRFVVEVDNASPNEIQSVTINGFGNAVYQNEKWIHNITPPWSGNPVSVTATVTMNTGKTITSQQIDVSLHSISTQWQSAQQFTDEPSSSFGTLHLARLHTPGGKWTAFQVPTGFTPYYNQIRVRIDISPEIPQGRQGTLHLEWYDPNDDESVSTATANPGAVRDNNASHGTLTFLGGKDFVFDDAHRQGTTTPALGRKVLNFPNDSFNANFIVAIHPRNGVEQQYEFRDNNKKILYFKDHDNTWKPLSLCTAEMIVLSWYGFDFKDKWTSFIAGKTFDASPKWIFKKDDYTMRTPLPTINATNSDNTDIAAITPHSLLDYGSDYNFQMSVDFDFTGASYVNANHPKNPHRSFHCNSGIKIYGLFEVQIYDTASLLALSQLDTIAANQQGAPKANWQFTQYFSNGIKKNGDTSFESISACVTGVPYLANTWHNKTQIDLENVKNVKHINFSLQWTNNKTRFKAITNGETYEDLQYGTGSNYNTSILNSNDKTIHLQGHWGSGVIFQQIVIQRSIN